MGNGNDGTDRKRDIEMDDLKFSPYVCPECQSMAMMFETVDGVDICGLCETPLIEYKAIPAKELAALHERIEQAEKNNARKLFRIMYIRNNLSDGVAVRFALEASDREIDELIEKGDE